MKVSKRNQTYPRIQDSMGWCEECLDDPEDVCGDVPLRSSYLEEGT